MAAIAVVLLLELYRPTFGRDGDVAMPRDGLCLYHCMTYGMSNGRGYRTRSYAERFRKEVIAKLRGAKKRVRAERLMLDGWRGYPR